MITLEEAYKLTRAEKSVGFAKLLVCRDLGDAWYFVFEGTYSENGFILPGSGNRCTVDKKNGGVSFHSPAEDMSASLTNSIKIPIEDILGLEHQPARMAYA
jgi:hypothetical protein